MIKTIIKNLKGYYSIARVTNGYPDKLIYSVLLNNQMYFLSKTIGVNDCSQLDGHQPLDCKLIDELNGVFAQIERDYRRSKSLDSINQKIYEILSKIRGWEYELG